MFVTIGYLIAFIAIFTFAFSISKIYYDMENAKNKHSLSKTSHINTTNRYSKVILNWKFNGKDRIIEKDCCGNYYLNGIMCDCKDIITYLSSSEQYDIGMGKIMAERKIDDNNNKIQNMTSSEYEEWKTGQERVYKICKKQYFINTISSISFNVLIAIAIITILFILGLFWYWICGGWLLFDVADSLLEFIVYFILSVTIFFYVISLFIRK